MADVNFRDININLAEMDPPERSWIEVNIDLGDIKIHSFLGYVCDCSASTLSLENHNGPEGGLTLKIRDEQTVVVETDGDFGSVMMRVTIPEAEMQALRRDLECITYLKGNYHIDLMKEPDQDDENE